MSRVNHWWSGAIALALGTLAPGQALACTACFGQSDSQWRRDELGIMSLLAIIVLVLIGVASFFVYLAKRTAAVSASAVVAQPVETTGR